jgi:hypothetical protein
MPVKMILIASFQGQHSEDHDGVECRGAICNHHKLTLIFAVTVAARQDSLTAVINVPGEGRSGSLGPKPCIMML